MLHDKPMTCAWWSSSPSHVNLEKNVTAMYVFTICNTNNWINTCNYHYNIVDQKYFLPNLWCFQCCYTGYFTFSVNRFYVSHICLLLIVHILRTKYVVVFLSERQCTHTCRCELLQWRQTSIMAIQKVIIQSAGNTSTKKNNWERTQLDWHFIPTAQHMDLSLCMDPASWANCEHYQHALRKLLNVVKALKCKTLDTKLALSICMHIMYRPKCLIPFTYS